MPEELFLQLSWLPVIIFLEVSLNTSTYISLALFVELHPAPKEAEKCDAYSRWLPVLLKLGAVGRRRINVGRQPAA